MNEEQVREIIRQQLWQFFKDDKYTFERLIKIGDGKNIQTGTTTGTKIGTGTDQKLGFFNATPVDKPETITDAQDAGGTYSSTQVQSIVDAVNTVISRLQELGLIK